MFIIMIVAFIITHLLKIWYFDIVVAPFFLFLACQILSNPAFRSRHANLQLWTGHHPPEDNRSTHGTGFHAFAEM